MCAVGGGGEGGRREVLNTTEQGAREEDKEEEGGGAVGVWMPDHSITFLLHFYSGIGKRKPKKECKREEIRLSWVNY